MPQGVSLRSANGALSVLFDCQPIAHSVDIECVTQQSRLRIDTSNGTCSISISGQRIRFSPSGVDRWQTSYATACGVETSQTLERVFTPGETWVEQDERPQWSYKRSHRTIDAQPPQTDGLGIPCDGGFVSEDVELDSRRSWETDAAACRTITVFHMLGYEHSDAVAPRSSRPEWIERQLLACPAPDLDGTEAVQRAEDARWERCRARVRREEQERRNRR